MVVELVIELRGNEIHYIWWHKPNKSIGERWRLTYSQARGLIA